MMTNYLGYTSKQWQESESVAFIQTYGKAVEIYSNGPDAIGFIANKEAYYIPRKYDPSSNKVNPHFDEEIVIMCNKINRNQALLVYFKSFYKRTYLADEEELKSACPLTVLSSAADGTIYRGR